MAAPTMPASLCRAAATTRARRLSSGRNLSACLLIPPPTMNRSGASRASRWSMYSSTRPAHLPQLRSCSSFARCEARVSASLPWISMWPNSVFGTRIPSWNSALPIPVPNVTITTVPDSPAPAPNFISATPAASASLSTLTWSPVASANSFRASRPIQVVSRLCAVMVVPLITTPGNVIPAGPVQPNPLARSRTTSATASGTAGRGVSILTRSAASLPVNTSTGAALIPVPPMSMPSTCTSQPPFRLVLELLRRDRVSDRGHPAPPAAYRPSLAGRIGPVQAINPGCVSRPHAACSAPRYRATIDSTNRFQPVLARPAGEDGPDDGRGGGRRGARRRGALDPGRLGGPSGNAHNTLARRQESEARHPEINGLYTTKIRTVLPLQAIHVYRRGMARVPMVRACCAGFRPGGPPPQTARPCCPSWSTGNLAVTPVLSAAPRPRPKRSAPPRGPPGTSSARAPG